MKDNMNKFIKVWYGYFLKFVCVFQTQIKNQATPKYSRV